MNLDSRLEADSKFILDLDLCQVRLHHNSAFPWIILIPRINGLVDIIDLKPADQMTLLNEITHASHVMKQIYNPHKLNIAALGNVVPQLHIHVIARFTTDQAWPAPIWNSGVTEVYDKETLRDQVSLIKETFCKF
jgi:diadenosine tetraphosphate (Ap4A) HIT family hydrolase